MSLLIQRKRVPVFIFNNKIQAFKIKLDVEKLISTASTLLKTTYHNRYSGEANKMISLCLLSQTLDLQKENITNNDIFSNLFCYEKVIFIRMYYLC